jgi:hypothetical protein
VQCLGTPGGISCRAKNINFGCGQAIYFGQILRQNWLVVFGNLKSGVIIIVTPALLQYGIIYISTTNQQILSCISLLSEKKIKNFF